MAETAQFLRLGTIMKADDIMSSNKQKSKKQTRAHKTDKEKLETLYKKVEKSAFTGKISTSNLKLKAEELGQVTMVAMAWDHDEVLYLG